MQNRRNFLKRSAYLSGVLSLGSTTLLALAPSKAWALELQFFDEKSAANLLRLCRHIYPHEKLDDAVYALVVKDLDELAANNETQGSLLQQGIAALDDKAGGDWSSFEKTQQFALVEAMADSDFFELVRSTAVVSLYNNELAFAHFGYAGSSYEKGGYLNRGFNDLDWLPTPPPNASPRT